MPPADGWSVVVSEPLSRPRLVGLLRRKDQAMTARYLSWLSEYWPTILAAAATVDVAVWSLIGLVVYRNRTRHPLKD